MFAAEKSNKDGASPFGTSVAISGDEVQQEEIAMEFYYCSSGRRNCPNSEKGGAKRCADSKKHCTKIRLRKWNHAMTAPSNNATIKQGQSVFQVGKE